MKDHRHPEKRDRAARADRRTAAERDDAERDDVERADVERTGAERTEAELADAEPPTPLAAIGAGLRRLRMQRGLRQYEAAEAAGVTKAMLSAYETGKRRPSLKTLDSLLSAMGADLGDLHRALVAHRRETDYLAGGAAVSRRWEVGEPPLAYGGRTASAWEPLGSAGGAGRGPAGADVYRLLGIADPLPDEEERALAEMLHGFLKLLRFMHHRFALAAGGPPSGGPFDG